MQVDPLPVTAVVLPLSTARIRGRRFISHVGPTGTGDEELHVGDREQGGRAPVGGEAGRDCRAPLRYGRIAHQRVAGTFGQGGNRFPPQVLEG